MAKDISVLQWNVWFQEDIHHVGEVIHSLDPDIICAQELTIGFEGQSVPNTVEYLSKLLGFYWYGKELPIEAPDGKRHTLVNAIFSRFPLVDGYSTWINIPSHGGGYGDEYRAYVEATAQLSDGPLTIATTHMSYTDTFIEADFKDLETEQLMEQLRRHDERFIFAGDLNALPDSKTIEAVSSYLQHAGPDFSENTWTTKPFHYRGFDATELNWRLDYIFTTKDMRVRESTTIDTNYSDHLPIFARLAPS